MPMVGGFLGGGVEMVPAGSGQLCLQWLTPDRLNLTGATFTVAGSTTTTVQAGADGRADVIVPAGTYVVSITHAGTYGNDKPQTVIVESTQSYLVMFGATSADISSLRLQCSEQFFGCNVEIRDAGGYVRASIDSVSSQEYEYILSAGTYTLAVGFGESEVEVMQSGATVVDLDDIFYAISINYSDVPINTSCVCEGREIAGSSTAGLKGENYSVSFSVPDMEQGKPYATVPDTTVSESLTELHPVASGIKYEFTSDRTLDLHGTFKVAVIGGGGGGACGYTSNGGAYAGGGGGGGGYLTVGQFAVDDSSIKIICGAGGSGGQDASVPATSGSASSFGNLLSASGGSGAIYGSMDGGSGGAGGGGGSYQKNTSGGDGGSSTYGGGGGGGWAKGAAGKTTLSTGGGSSGEAATSSAALGGGDGGEANLPQILLDLGYSNGAGGSGASGGGGGGLIGKGGDGDQRFSSTDAAGGGGGGGLGNGGYGSDRTTNGGSGGAGGGGGGGGGQGGYGGYGGRGAVIVKWVSR